MVEGFDKILTDYRSAARDAYKQVAQVAGVPLLNRELAARALRNMTEQDLDALAGEYGADQVMHYINYAMGGRHG